VTSWRKDNRSVVLACRQLRQHGGDSPPSRRCGYAQRDVDIHDRVGIHDDDSANRRHKSAKTGQDSG
jgi:hypothetical protein